MFLWDWELHWSLHGFQINTRNVSEIHMLITGTSSLSWLYLDLNIIMGTLHLQITNCYSTESTWDNTNRYMVSLDTTRLKLRFHLYIMRIWWHMWMMNDIKGGVCYSAAVLCMKGFPAWQTIHIRTDQLWRDSFCRHHTSQLHLHKWKH